MVKAQDNKHAGNGADILTDRSSGQPKDDPFKPQKVSVLKQTLKGAAIGAAAGLGLSTVVKPSSLLKARGVLFLSTPMTGAGSMAEGAAEGAASGIFLDKMNKDSAAKGAGEPKPEPKSRWGKIAKKLLAADPEKEKAFLAKAEENRPYGMLMVAVHSAGLGAIYGFVSAQYQNKPAKEYEKWQKKVQEGKIPGMDSQPVRS
jgi:hypothetical protein